MITINHMWMWLFFSPKLLAFQVPYDSMTPLQAALGVRQVCVLVFGALLFIIIVITIILKIKKPSFHGKHWKNIQEHKKKSSTTGDTKKLPKRTPSNPTKLKGHSFKKSVTNAHIVPCHLSNLHHMTSPPLHIKPLLSVK